MNPSIYEPPLPVGMYGPICPLPRYGPDPGQVKKLLVPGPRSKATASDPSFDAAELSRLAERITPAAKGNRLFPDMAASLAASIACDPWALVTPERITELLGEDNIALARHKQVESARESQAALELAEGRIRPMVDVAKRDGDMDFLQLPHISNPDLRDAMRSASNRRAVSLAGEAWGILRPKLPALGGAMLAAIEDIERDTAAIWSRAGATWSCDQDAFVHALRTRAAQLVAQWQNNDRDVRSGRIPGALKSILAKCPADTVTEPEAAPEAGPFTE